jgi:galactokinase
VSRSREQRTFRSPGRVNLIGEHTDYSGGLVLPVAIALDVTISATPAQRIELRSALDGASASLAADGSTIEPPVGWARYVAAVAHELDRLGRPPIGIAGTIESEVPSGAGLASSAALEVAVAIALCAIADWDALRPLELAAACRRAELRAVGVPCGILDQAACVLGEEGAAIYLDCATLEHEPVPLPGGLSLLIVDSGVRHQLEHSGYAQRRRELEEALVILDGRRPADVSIEDMERRASRAGLDALHHRRLRHVVTENDRVRALVQALRAHPTDTDLVGRILHEGHLSQRDDYETSTPELDDLVDIAYASGAFGARMTGGGFGGSIVAIVDENAAADIAAATIAAYRSRHAFEARAYVCSAAAGAGEVSA